MFQFQYGTIKSFNFFFTGVNPRMFQFQYGTIKSITDIVKSENILSFNSNMVRLKGRRRRRGRRVSRVSIPIWYD